MAGIGFELKKLFSRKGLLATARAYGYATLVCTGPMLLGYVLLLCASIMADASGTTQHNREILVSVLTHTLLASLVVTSMFSMITTRFCADMIYEKKYHALIPSFYGSLWMMLIIGGIGYGIFLHFSGIILLYQILAWILFMVLIVVWTEINYLNMLKNYRSIMIAFAVSVVVAIGLGAILIWCFHIEAVTALLVSITVGYSIMLVWYFILIYHYFPEGFGTSIRFLEWFEKTPQLGFTGFFITLGLFGHLLIMWWFSSLKVQVVGLFYGAPTYDVPAIFAFFSILITTVNFTTSVETRFYPRYKEYFSLFNDGGSIENINEAEDTMIHVLSDEMGYLALKQIFSTLFFIIIGTIILPQLPLGIDSEMLGIYRILCIGYAFYAIGNSIMLISQYFADLKGALMDALLFVVLTNGCSIILALATNSFYGFGFIIGSAAFCIIAIIRLCWYLRKLKFNVISRQPLVSATQAGMLAKMADHFDKRAVRIQEARRNYCVPKEKEIIL